MYAIFMLFCLFQMMVHSGAQCADSLCQLNGWGRTTVPLHALELGLRQLQLDTVAFFLCTKENCKPMKQELEVYSLFSLPLACIPLHREV